MNIDEKVLLTAWSQGLAGADARLAKRAWWVLEDHERRPPGALVGTWANASEAQSWILNFHSMGIVGLMDAPRKGRPQKHADAIGRVQDRLEALTAEGENANKERASLLGALSHMEKESLWHALRRTGADVLRNRKGLNVPVPTPIGLRDLLCVHLGASVKILSFFKTSHLPWDQTNGLWMGVPNARIKEAGVKAKKYDLLHALSTEIRLPVSPYDRGTAQAKAARKEDALEGRVVSHIEHIARTYPGLVVAYVLVDIRNGEQLIKALKSLRKGNLWRASSSKSPGLLADLRVVPFSTSWATAAQVTLASNLPHVDELLLGELQDKLTLKRRSTFSWIRTADIDQAEPLTSWLEQEESNEID